MIFMNNKYKGYLAVIVSGTTFGCMPLLAKNIFASGGNAINLVFWRFFIPLPLLYLIMKNNKNISTKITKEELKKIILVGSIGYAGTAILLFMSYNYISSGMATTLHFVYPIFVILASIIIYKEKANPIKIFSVALCTIGIFLLYNGDSKGDILGIGLAFLSGITYSFYVMYLDKSGLKDMDSIKLTFYLCLIASFVMFAFSIGTGSFTVSITPLGWLLTIVLAIAVALGAVNLLNLGIKIIGPQSASILSTFEPITSVVIGVLVFKEKLDLKILIGCMLILLSVIIITASDKEHQKSIS